MKYVCSRCGKVIQEHDVTIHYTTGDNGLEIVAVCQLCLEKYLEKAKGDAHIKKDENEKEMVAKIHGFFPVERLGMQGKGFEHQNTGKKQPLLLLI